MDAFRRTFREAVGTLLAASVLGLAGCGSAAPEATGAGPGSPAAEQGEARSRTRGVAVLSWLPNAEPDLAGYRVYYGLAPGLPEAAIDVGLATTATVTSLDVGHRYYFVVTAYDTAGNESGYSNEVFKDVL